MSQSRSEFRRALIACLCDYAIVVVSFSCIIKSDSRGRELERLIHFALVIVILAFHMAESYRIRRIKTLERNEAASNQYINALDFSYEKLRSIRHNWYNSLQVYEGYIETNNIQALQSYHETVVKNVSDTRDSVETIVSLSERREIYALMLDMLQKAERQDVQMEIAQIECVSRAHINDIDLSYILGCLLDNAICLAAKTSRRHIKISCEAKGQGSITLEISSPVEECAECEPERGNSTDGVRTFDTATLNTIRGILSSYDNCYILTDCRDGRLHTYLTLQCV